ncbi:MAG: Holliday junction branch migration protein RuvA [Chlamydiae bacterium]|nr:Holliday junction branch migration protein RuvA [Chlamydiota bacterium]
MYEAIFGILKEKEPMKAIVETGGVSYRLTIPLNTYSKLPSVETSIRLFLSHIVREDSQTLYAFWSKEERDLFEVLINLSGIGPKTAAAIVGHMEIDAFHHAISAADIRILSKIPGIGKKTAERLVIEMKDKVKMKKGNAPLISGPQSLLSDAVSALMNLGYPPMDAQKAVKLAMQENQDADLGLLISVSLRKI